MSKMGEGTKLVKATKTKIGVAVGAVAVSAAVLAVVLLSGEESFRTVAVEEVNGTSLVTSNGNEAVNAYEGMHLYSGDDVSVQQDSDMTMVLDMDKYVYAEPGTHFWLECDGTTDDSRTVIYLDEGSILNRIKENLNEGEVYQVDTPNSTMAVRGTVFRVTVYRGEDGLVYTLLEVFEGQVQVDLKTEDGEYNGVSETFGPGEAALIRGNSDFSEFVLEGTDDAGEPKGGSVKLSIDYKEIPQDTARMLVQFMDDGEELCIVKELLMDYTKLAEHRMETRAGKESTCTEAGYEEIWCVVCNEVTETVQLPLLEHSPSDWEVTSEPTCEETGSRQKICTVCGTVCEEEELEAIGHVEGEIQTLTAATCTGIGEQVLYCEVCDKEIQRVVVNALGHTEGNAITIKAASCTEDGITQVKCSVCGVVLREGSIAKNGHSWGNWETVSTGNCTTQGKERRTCGSCGSTEEQSTGGGSHSWSWETTREATCEEVGEQTGTCSVCGATDTKTIAATGHSMEWETYDGDFPCVQYWDGVCTIDGCDYEESKIIENHNFTRHEHVNYNAETGTVTCVMMCEMCPQTDETPIHESCEVSGAGTTLKCKCGFDVAIPH